VQVERHQEDALIVAGFTAVSANTPQRQATLTSMPAHRFVHETRNGTTRYGYADPTICGCVYVGDQAAYNRYRQQMSVQELSNEQQMNDDLYHVNWDSLGQGWQ
jgi:hypothetical protein